LRRALVSIHDVMPSNLDDIAELIRLCRGSGMDALTLLVVPGLNWSPDGIDRLRRFQDDGCELAGHGWHHRCEQITGLKHRLHSRILSRNVAEHLALSADGIARLIGRCGEWFDDHRFRPPLLYVPPAWAMGAIPERRLAESPFALFETLTGVVAPQHGIRHRLPLVGFEADTPFRKACLKTFNALGRRAADRGTRPLRISIHPTDHRLLLAGDLRRVLDQPQRAVSYRSLIASEENLGGALTTTPPNPQPHDARHMNADGQSEHDSK